MQNQNNKQRFVKFFNAGIENALIDYATVMTWEKLNNSTKNGCKFVYKGNYQDDEKTGVYALFREFYQRYFVAVEIDK